MPLKWLKKLQKPPIEDLVSDVYDTPIPLLDKQLEELKAHVKAHPEAYPTTAGRIK